MTRRGLVLDATIALLFAGAAFVEAATHLDHGYRGQAPSLLAGSVAAAGALPLVLRRMRPRTAFVLTAAIGSLPHLAVSFDPVFVGGGLVLVVAAEAVGRYGGPRAAVVLLAAVPAIAVIAVAVPGFGSDAPAFAALVAAGWAFGVLLRALVERRSALAGEVAAREEAAVLVTERTVVAERLRVARDLHDVIAHGVAVMVLQAGAARVGLGRDERGTATAIELVESTGHEVLTELQRVLGLLRGDALEGPTDSLASLDPLTRRLGAAGLAVRLTVDGDPGVLPPALDRSLFRVVQESLTNALKHGQDGAADVHLRFGAARVELEVVNRVEPATRPSLPGGNGRTGMRERIAAFGGELSAGSSGDRYRVHAVVPLPEPVP